jgi:hypothetical protein
MKIQPINSKSLLNTFIDFPHKLHKNTHNWIAPLKLDQKNIFNPKKNSALSHCDYELFLLYNEKKIIGRIAAYVNHVANDYWGEKIGFFGHYECINNQQAANLLLSTAEKWLKSKGAKIMRGQWNFGTQDIGFICEGFDLAPTILSSYNPPFYNDHVFNFGMKKAKDLLVYNCDSGKGYQIPERFLRLTDKIAQRYGVIVRPIDKKKMVEETRIIVKLTNASIADNWGFYPVDESEAEQIAADLKLIVDPEIVLIAEVKGEPVGYILTLPDINDILKNMNGRLLPTGIFKLLFGIKKLNRYRIWAMGFSKPFQKKGISVLMFHRLHEVLAQKNFYVEANWVLEDNYLMNNALVQLNFDLVKKYRIYEKEIR